MKNENKLINIRKVTVIHLFQYIAKQMLHSLYHKQQCLLIHKRI